MSISKRILIAPLDWGLGHMSRCVPLIRHLLERGCTVFFAGTAYQHEYIRPIFPDLQLVHLDGYDIRYGKNLIFSLLVKIPGLFRKMQKEHAWLQNFCRENDIQGIISDNRYGLFHPKIPSVILTHQLLIQSGWGEAADNILKNLHYKYLQRFNECWVVDISDKKGLSGRLAHPTITPGNSKYIGLLSHMAPGVPREEHLLILLSGPEPQRTLLSDILWEQLKDYKGKVIFVEGSDEASRQSNSSPLGGGREGAYYTRITSPVLQPLIEKASMVVCRSGYSTLMDLAILRKKAILVPTPGQTEQELLGKYLHREGVFYSTTQKHFNLQQALNDAQLFPFRQLELNGAHELYKGVVDDWLKNL